MTPKKVTAKPDADVLMPVGVEHKIGDRTYTQEPLTIRTMGGVLAVAAVIFGRVLDDPDVLASLQIINLDTMVGRAQAVQTAVKMIMSVPPELPAFLAAVLNVDSLDDAEYIGDHCRPVTLVKIIDTFIEQNEPEEMIQAFFALQTRLAGLEIMNKILDRVSTN